MTHEELIEQLERMRCYHEAQSSLMNEIVDIVKDALEPRMKEADYLKAMIEKVDANNEKLREMQLEKDRIMEVKA